MPFDGFAPNHDPAVVIVDHMIATLRDPDHWIKGRMKETLHGGTRYCLMGALKQASELFPKAERRSLQRSVREMMTQVITGEMKSPAQYTFAKRLMRFRLFPQTVVMQFNDDCATGHGHVMLMLAMTRQRLVAQACV